MKETLDSIWGDEDGRMLVICKTSDSPGIEFSIGMPPGNIQALITLAPYRVKRLIEILEKTLK